jgi:hypothetical protein
MYCMKTADLVKGEVVFSSSADFDEAIEVGFFRIPIPQNVDVRQTRAFSKSFHGDSTYTDFKALSLADGFFRPDLAQSVHFSLERDNWAGVYPQNVREVGDQLTQIGSQILRSILEKFNLPRELWFKATSGASDGEGSCYLVFRHYDPEVTNKPVGLTEHRDWGFITVLDASSDGLEAEIDGVWHPLAIEEGYLTINFGEPLHKLLPQVNASNHRVALQTHQARNSTVLFIDPRVGSYRQSSGLCQEEGLVWEWNPQTRQLVNSQTTLRYFEEMSRNMYG